MKNTTDCYLAITNLFLLVTPSEKPTSLDSHHIIIHYVMVIRGG